MGNCLNSALKYESMGFSIIPLNKNKKPFVEWKEYQKRRANQEEIRDWWKKWPNANIGIVTGAISGICVIDIDSEAGAKEIEKFIPESLEMPIVSTPSGGKHYYFKMPDEPMCNNVGIIPGCDFRGEGGYIVAPPSKCKSKTDKKIKSYAWQVPISNTILEIVPGAYKKYINNAFNNNKNISKNDATNAQNAQNTNNNNGFGKTDKKGVQKSPEIVQTSPPISRSVQTNFYSQKAPVIMTFFMLLIVLLKVECQSMKYAK